MKTASQDAHAAAASAQKQALKASHDRRLILWTMILGFSLMIGLVLCAAYFGYYKSIEIQESAQALVRERRLDERDIMLESEIESESAQLLSELSWLMGACFVLAAAGATLTVWIIDRALRQLELQGHELSRVSWSLVDGHEKTARRFAHEMHDELGQSLTGLKNMLQRSPDSHREEMIDVLNEVMGEMRELSQMLRPVILDDYGLDAALRWLRDRFVQRTQIRVSYESNFTGRLAGPIETHLFRVAQEALTNIARHSQASEAVITLAVSDRDVRLIVEDNGAGLSSGASAKAGLGMVGMRARMRQLQGTLVTEARPGGGLRIRAQAPLSEASHGEDLDEDEWRN